MSNCQNSLFSDIEAFMTGNLLDDAIAILNKFVAEEHKGNRSAAARVLGLGSGTLGQWLDRKRAPNLEALSPVFAKLGVGFTGRRVEPTRDVCFINAKIVPADDNVEPPREEDYIAVPLVGEVGAGPGYAPQDEIRSWFLVYKNIPSIMYRHNFLAVEIAKGSRSMVPTLYPGDIVLVDRDDCTVSSPGKMWLVKDEYDQGMIKRVKIDKVSRDDLSITYYSDNIKDYPPITYSLRRHFDNDLSRAIVGRVIWAWSDVSEK